METHREYFNRLAEKWDELMDKPEKVINRILAFAPIKKGAHLLDVGCGTGILLPYLLERTGPEGKVMAMDIAEEMLRKAKKKYSFPNLLFHHADASKTGLPSQSFDGVLCYSVFPHFQDKEAALGEINRLLKPGGWILIAHAQGREQINMLHRKIGGLVAGDSLLDYRSMQEFFRQTGLREHIYLDKEDLYIFLGVKEDRSGHNRCL